MHRTLSWGLVAAALLSSLAAGAAQAAATPAAPAVPSPTLDRAAIEQRHRADRQACLAEPAAAERQNCLREAGAARAEALQGRLGRGSDADDWARNRLVRCQVHDDPVDRRACERLARGEGRQAGSVAQGAVVRELTVTAEPPPAGTRTP